VPSASRTVSVGAAAENLGISGGSVQRENFSVRDFHREIFSTVIRNFAQIFWTNSVDDEKRKDYFARQIEPEDLKLNGSVQSSRLLHGFRDSELGREV
jgi:hypothetical protein